MVIQWEVKMWDILVINEMFMGDTEITGDIELVLGGALDIEALLTNTHLVGGWAYPSEKWWSSSVGMMKFPIDGKSQKIMFQTTNQFWISIKRKHSPEDLGYFGIVTPTRTTISSVTSRRGGCIPIPWAEQMTSSFLQLHPAVHSLNHYIYRYTVIYLP